ncbi:dTDP-4-dehydrorhamnose reductase [Paenibacillus sp. FSL R7-0297]|uniref:dTDP-4-dehydrorhamnose reductase n=1 Tax=Paenibacillus sp. FSL R7-0297 TaxID=2921680 RepID=UPI0030FA5241
MRVLVTGSNGQLGHDVLICLSSQNIDCLGVDRVDFDLTDLKLTAQFIQEYKPDVMIHCAAFTNVDLAESEIEKCYALNVEATTNIAIQCKKVGSKLVYISTDYIFSGESLEPYETDSGAEPLSVYGKTKLLGEESIRNNILEHFVVRTSWSFGTNGSNFVNTMLRLGREKESIDVVCDQVGSPTYTIDLAKSIVEMIGTTNYGTYHVTNEGYCSWAEFAVEIFKQSGLKTKVNFITSDKFPSVVKRPKNSILSKKSLYEGRFQPLPEWKDALKRYLIEIGIRKE